MGLGKLIHALEERRDFKKKALVATMSRIEPGFLP